MNPMIGMALIGLVLMVTSCAGSDQIQHLRLDAGPVSPLQSQRSQPTLSLTVGPFTDGRGENPRLGVRHHLFGGETYFALGDGHPAGARLVLQ